jgi:two-component system, chemotaxis family, protein-glutamate methylesterase/glutaminase
MSTCPIHKPIRVLVVEDSPSQRELLVGLLSMAEGFDVAGIASNGQEAIDATLRLRPDVIAMDIHLPILDGYDATRQIMQRCPTPIVRVSSSSDDASRRSIQAIAVGALAVVRKPTSAALTDHRDDRNAFLTTLRLMAGVRVVTRFPSRPALPLQEEGQPVRSTIQSCVENECAGSPAASAAPQVLAIAASTGGPAAVQTLLRGLGAHFSLPILIVQHIARGFVPALVSWLDTTVPQTVTIARLGERLRPGYVYLAPDDHHLMVRDRAVIALRPGAVADRYCPSADVLFETVAHVYGARAIGVVLTGMGDDGTQGMRALLAMGGQTLAQDEASCIVYGMPRAAVAAGSITTIAPLTALAGIIMQSVMGAHFGEAA